jgi:cellular nucleic acid-binding protein
MAYQFSRKGCFKCGNRMCYQIYPNYKTLTVRLLVGHIAENCSSEQRLCYNCRQPGHESSACPSPRTVATKQCYSCGGVGHIQGSTEDCVCIIHLVNLFFFLAECPSLRVQQGGNQKCYVSWQVFEDVVFDFDLFKIQNCGRFGHFARSCTSVSGGGAGFASRAPPPGRALNTSTLPPVKCYRCGGPNHMAK